MDGGRRSSLHTGADGLPARAVEPGNVGKRRGARGIELSAGHDLASIGCEREHVAVDTLAERAPGRAIPHAHVAHAGVGREAPTRDQCRAVTGESVDAAHGRAIECAPLRTIPLGDAAGLDGPGPDELTACDQAALEHGEAEDRSVETVPERRPPRAIPARDVVHALAPGERELAGGDQRSLVRDHGMDDRAHDRQPEAVHQS